MTAPTSGQKTGRMTALTEALSECERWFSYLEAQKNKATEMQKIAAARRAGEIDEQEGRRRVRALDGCGVTVFDGAKLEKAVRILVKHAQGKR